MSSPGSPSSSSPGAYAGIWVPIVTPFSSGRIDPDAVHRLVDSVAKARCQGIVVCGTTGEAATLSAAEQRELLGLVYLAAKGRLKIAMGVAGNDTAAVVRAVQSLNNSAADVVLISAPAYTRPTQQGLRQHFEQIAAASQQPIIIYNIPYRTGVNLDIDTARQLAQNGKFVGFKESAGENIDQLFDLIETTPLTVFCGEDRLVFTAACLGARGAIAAAANVRPDLYVRLFYHVASGRIEAARILFAQLMPLIRVLFAEPNPTVIKAALAMQGIIDDELRLPMLPATPATREKLGPVLEAVMALP